MIRKTETLPNWDLSDLYRSVDDPQLQQDMDSAQEQAARFEEVYRGTIAVQALQPAHLLEALAKYEQLLRFEYRPQAYAMLLYSTDTRDPERGALLQRTREFGSAVASHLVFFDLEIGRISEDTYAAVRGTKQLAPYRHYLDHQRRLAAHNLSEPEEKILVETANARGQAFSRLFTEVHGGARYHLTHGEEKREMNQQELLSLLYSPDRELRRVAAASLTEGLQGNAHVCTFIYNTLLHEKEVLDRLRGFATPEASRHLSNELDAEIVDTVVNVCVANYPTVARYYRLKRRLLGLSELTHIDRYAPILGEQTAIPFAQARETVLDAFGSFSSRFSQIAARFFNERWIDADVTDGKRGGAFCASVTPDLHPYVLLNYTGQPRDVMTLAHELGHGVHDVLASNHHLLDYHPVLPMAETASTFGEMLVFDRLQCTLASGEERLALLCSKIEDAFATVFRQVAMFRFEQRAHAGRRSGGELTTDRFNELWQECQQEMFGDALQLGAEHACWWLYIPHIINTPFYVYAYAFGELLVLALYAQYQKEGDAFVERYLQLLAAGGSQAPVELISGLGFDVRSPDFWQGGCDLIRESVEQAEALAPAEL